MEEGRHHPVGDIKIPRRIDGQVIRVSSPLLITVAENIPIRVQA